MNVFRMSVIPKLPPQLHHGIETVEWSLGMGLLMEYTSNILGFTDNEMAL